MKSWFHESMSRLRAVRDRPAVDAVNARHSGGVRAVTDAPLPRSGRWLLAAMLLFVAATLLWACLGSIDVVAFAQGRTVVSSRVQPVQAVERTMVTEVLVEEGDRVAAGEPVIYLQRAGVAAATQALGYRLAQSRAELARVEALLAAGPDSPPKLITPQGVAEAIAAAERDRMRGEWAAHRQQIAELGQRHANRRAEAKASRASIAATEAVMPYLQRQVERLQRLAERGAASRSRLDQARRKLTAKTGALAVERRQLEVIRGKVALAERELAVARTRFRAELLDERAGIAERRARLRRELVTAQAKLERHTLRAPIAGIVQDLAVRAAGAVVEPAQALMRIVPAERPLEVEAKILNRDIGFVREGQSVDVKLAAYDFTRYGTVPGIIREISPSSTVDRQLGRVYTALVALKRHWIKVAGERVALRPGMTATVDIELGSRRVIEYFLAPILRYQDQALREH